MSIFDPHLVSLRQLRAQRRGAGSFLWSRITNDLRDRLLDIRRNFTDVVEIAPFPSVFTIDLKQRKQIENVSHVSSSDFGTEEILPLEPYTLDGLISWGHLHSVNALPEFLFQCRHALKPDGVFIGAMIGGESLYQLRDSITQTELQLYGGISPRVAPFAALPDMAQLMQNAGFALPVIDSDLVTITYTDLKTLVNDLRDAGQTNIVAQQNKKYPGRDFWTRVEDYYRAHHSENGRLVATIEIIYVLGWAPHESQQKPLKPGSATIRLADILNTEEKGTGDFV